MSFGSIVGSLAKGVLHLVKGSSSFVKWVNSDTQDALNEAADDVLAKYGDAAKQLVLDLGSAVADAAHGGASSPLTKAEMLFKVATDLGTLIAAHGISAPFGVLVIAAQRAFEQTKVDAGSAVETDLRSFIAAFRGIEDHTDPVGTLAAATAAAGKAFSESADGTEKVTGPDGEESSSQPSPQSSSSGSTSDTDAAGTTHE